MDSKIKSGLIAGLLLVLGTAFLFTPSDAGIPPTPAFETFRVNGTDVIADSSDDVLLVNSDDSILFASVEGGLGGPDPNYPDWGARKTITIDNAQVDADLTDFPILISITDTDVKDNAQADGDDIMFVASDGSTQLSHEIEKYDSATGELVAWVKSDLTGSTDTIIYMYYGNGAATNQEDVTGTWNSGYKGVWHLHDDFLDSTSNNHDGTNSGSTDVLMQIADGQSFDGLGDKIDTVADSSLDNSSTFTVSFWASSTVNLNDRAAVSIYKGTGGARVFAIYPFDNTGGNGISVWHTGQSIMNENGVERADGTPYYFTFVSYNSTDHRMFADGAQVSSDTSTQSLESALTDLDIGAWKTIQLFDGKLDEVKVSNVARSAEWIATEFNNQDSPGTFYSISAEESFGIGDEIILSLNSPAASRLGGVFSDDCAPDSVTAINTDGTVNCGIGNVDATVPHVVDYFSPVLATDTINVTNIPPFDFYQVDAILEGDTATPFSIDLTFNNDTNNNYAYRGTDDTNDVAISTSSNADRFIDLKIYNSAVFNKVGFAETVFFDNPDATGVAIEEVQFTYNGTAIQSLKFTLVGFNQWTADSHVTVLGWNSTG